ncbi:MAG: LamB/YcsF family protein [Syntrophales bacterium]|nr:LamB/YcsF family protein [Syntrophales bacterium]
MQRIIDLNCDMGESFGQYRIGADETIIKHITSANIACGFHASDPTVMDRTVRLCKDHGVMAGAHPGFPDKVGFGRRFMDIAEADLINDIVYQVGALKGFLNRYGMPLQHVKLHGELYNSMVRKPDLFLKLALVLKEAFGNPILLTLSTEGTTALKDTFRDHDLRLALEAFPDRLYNDGGELMPRKIAGAVIKDPDTIARRAAQMAFDRVIESESGRRLNLGIDTLCLHGDNKESIDAASQIVQSCHKAGIAIKPLSEFI